MIGSEYVLDDLALLIGRLIWGNGTFGYERTDRKPSLLPVDRTSVSMNAMSQMSQCWHDERRPETWGTYMRVAGPNVLVAALIFDEHCESKE